MTYFRAAHRQVERRPGVGHGIEFNDAIRGPQIAPDVVLAVDGDVIRLHGRVGELDEAGLQRTRVDLGQRVAPGVTYPQHIGVFIGAHAPRSLRPRQRGVEAGPREARVEAAVLRAQAVEFRLQCGQFYRDGFAGGDVPLADRIDSHLRPPTVTVAVAGCAIGGDRPFVCRGR